MAVFTGMLVVFGPVLLMGVALLAEKLMDVSPAVRLHGQGSAYRYQP